MKKVNLSKDNLVTREGTGAMKTVNPSRGSLVKREGRGAVKKVNPSKGSLVIREGRSAMKLVVPLLLLAILRQSLGEELSEDLVSCFNDNNDTVVYCNTTDGFTCRDGMCRCPKQYYLNYTTGKCEDQLNYITANNLDEYRVKPGLYCETESQCLEGLVCDDFKCACPTECEYSEEEEACDCGKEVPVGPIVTGCLSGLLIVFFWGRVLQETFQRFEKKRASRLSPLSSSGEEAASSYPLSPTSPLNQNGLVT